MEGIPAGHGENQNGIVCYLHSGAKSPKVCSVSVLPPCVRAVYMGWSSLFHRSFPLSVLPFNFPVSFLLQLTTFVGTFAVTT